MDATEFKTRMNLQALLDGKTVSSKEAEIDLSYFRWLSDYKVKQLKCYAVRIGDVLHPFSTHAQRERFMASLSVYDAIRSERINFTEDAQS